MVGCGAAAAIAGAFGAPLAGAFYAFELVIGGYTPASLTPVGVAAVVGYFVAHAFTVLSIGVGVGPVGDVLGRDLAVAALLGILAALFGIVIMRGVALCEHLLSKTGIWPPLRPAFGGLAVGLLALVTPQVMSSGHGALHFAGFVSIPMAVLATIFLLKAIASIISLGSGFRGGLFFAVRALFLGALGGHLFAAELRYDLARSQARSKRLCDHRHERAVGIGGRRPADDVVHRARIDRQPLAQHRRAGRRHHLDPDHPRELFGYSFATWRLHLRGETIRSAADVGWIRDLTVRRLMRPDVTTVSADMPIEEFRDKFPLGSKTQVIAVDAAGCYAGLVLVAEAHAPEIEATSGLADILHVRDVMLLPAMNIQEAIAVFDAAEAESLAVVEAKGQHRPIGILTEAHAMRRYAEESEQRRREAVGEI